MGNSPPHDPGLRRWTTVRTDAVASNPFWEYRRDVVRLPDGTDHDYHYVHTPGSVMLIPLDERGPLADDPALLLVRQYRHLLGVVALELPGGGIRPGQTPEQAALAELREETGCSGTLELLGRFNPCKGITDEVCHVFLATDLRTDPMLPDRTEEVVVEPVPLARVDERVAAQEVCDGMTLASLAMARHHPRLLRNSSP